jgi:alpha-ketoglutarate-dependent taurine dioxygenase
MTGRMFDLEPIDATFGAVVTGVALADLDRPAWETLYAAWLDYALLVFPHQFLSRDEQVEFARRFGPIEQIGGGEIVAITNVLPDGTVRAHDPAAWDDMMKIIVGNMSWHADSTYMPVQAKGAVFSAEVVTRVGGETGWADMRAAYDALDPTTRDLVEGGAAHHSLAYSQSKVGHVHSEGSAYIGYGFHDGVPVRPLVKVHPETGRKSLLIGRHAHAVPGLSADESERFLDDLVDAACRPPRTYHHQWQAGDVVVWDNRCLLHRARPWDLTQPRVMWHSRLAGDPSTESAPMA